MTLKYVCSTVKSGPGPLNITFGSDMPITLLHLMLISKIYVVNSDMKNVIGMSDPNVMFKGPGPPLFTFIGSFGCLQVTLEPHKDQGES